MSYDLQKFLYKKNRYHQKKGYVILQVCLIISFRDIKNYFTAN